MRQLYNDAVICQSSSNSEPFICKAGKKRKVVGENQNADDDQEYPGDNLKNANEFFVLIEICKKLVQGKRR